MAYDYGYGDLGNKLIELFRSGAPDFDAAEDLIRQGADINAIGKDDDENILSEILGGYWWSEHGDILSLTKLRNRGGKKMKLDGVGLFVEDMPTMVRFYRDVLGFEIAEEENAANVYLIKNGTLFMLYRRRDFEKMTSRKYEYLKGFNGHFEIALYVDTFEEVDKEYAQAIAKGAQSVLEPTTEPWGQRTCYIADPEGNLIEIGSFNRPFNR